MENIEDFDKNLAKYCNTYLVYSESKPLTFSSVPSIKFETNYNQSIYCVALYHTNKNIYHYLINN